MPVGLLVGVEDPAMHELHSVYPVLGVKVPAVQGTQAAWPDRICDLPASQGWHTDCCTADV